MRIGWLLGKRQQKGNRRNAQMEMLNLVQPAKQGYLYYSIYAKIEASGSQRP